MLFSKTALLREVGMLDSASLFIVHKAYELRLIHVL